jgi:8-oxo-dGTP diphosphatase
LLFKAPGEITYFQCSMVSLNQISVVCAIIENDGKILAAKRSDLRPHGGFWEFPGGKIEEGEDAEKAIVREIREELGTEISVRRRLPSSTFEYPDKTVILTPFICAIVSGTPAPLEHAEIRWVDKCDAQALAWLPPDAEIFENFWKLLSNP